MSDQQLSNPEPQRPAASSGWWKLWLLGAFFVGWIVLAQMEAHSPEADARRAAAYSNAVYNSRTEAIEQNCGPGDNQGTCAAAVQGAVDMTRDKLAPQLGVPVRPDYQAASTPSTGPNPFNPDSK